LRHERDADPIRLFGGTRSTHPQLYDPIMSVTEEMVKFTLLTRARADRLVNSYSGRRKSAEALMKRVNRPVAT
jgi:hypothetical protein